MNCGCLVVHDPKTTLNRGFIVPIPAERCRNADPHVRQYVQTELAKTDSLFAKALPSIPGLSIVDAGISADAHRTKTNTTSLTTMDISAVIFHPTDSYMAEALRNEEVINYVRSGFFRKSLYIISGVATAGHVAMKERQGHGRGSGTSAHAAVSGIGEAELGFEHARDVKNESKLETVKPCDFAYRAREFVYGRGKLKDKGDYVKSAMFGKGKNADRSTSVEDDEEEDVPEFQFMEDSDVEMEL